MSDSFVSGFVSILGRPSAGKSTLLNALVGAKLAIVAEQPQTTRTSVQGVWTAEGSQVVFLDTPGIHRSDTMFNRRMMMSVRSALDARDLLLYIVDATRRMEEGDAKRRAILKLVRGLVRLRKTDRECERARHEAAAAQRSREIHQDWVERMRRPAPTAGNHAFADLSDAELMRRMTELRELDEMTPAELSAKAAALGEEDEEDPAVHPAGQQNLGSNLGASLPPESGTTNSKSNPRNQRYCLASV